MIVVGTKDPTHGVPNSQLNASAPLIPGPSIIPFDAYTIEVLVFDHVFDELLIFEEEV
jgi:hypothetical protein